MQPSPSPSPIHGHCEPRFEGVRRVFEENFRSGADLGAAVAFTLNGEPVVDLWGGYLDRAKSREWERDTLVNVYSTTKGMTAICAHQLIERGKLDVEAPVAQYWPEFAAAGKAEIPVRDLLSHRAGLPAISKRLPADAIFDWQQMTEALAEQAPWWEPGTQHGYHPVTFGFLVGELVRRISGQSLGTFFRQNVAEPLAADFHIGLATEHDARTAELFGQLIGRTRATTTGKTSVGNDDPAKKKETASAAEPGRLPKAMRDFMRDMSDPNSMTGAAFGNPPTPRGTVNSRAWRAAEVPAANGHGNARALARIYGALSCGGEVGGVRILEQQSIERAIVEHSNGPDAVLGQLPMRFGLGFMLHQPIMPMGPNRRAFGHAGAGGSLGMADPDAGVGFGFTMNRMQMGLTGSAGAFAMIRSFFEAL